MVRSSHEVFLPQSSRPTHGLIRKVFVLSLSLSPRVHTQRGPLQFVINYWPIRWLLLQTGIQWWYVCVERVSCEWWDDEWEDWCQKHCCHPSHCLQRSRPKRRRERVSVCVCVCVCMCVCVCVWERERERERGGEGVHMQILWSELVINFKNSLSMQNTFSHSKPNQTWTKKCTLNEHYICSTQFSDTSNKGVWQQNMSACEFIVIKTVGFKQTSIENRVP